ncbi:MAG: HD domain-containing protein [Lewinellaceae bacterium]|nr:HD domain-containing protein [Saprospiraceae bacterium]MCB9338325.1 HD domain-containing protein [Lewinellaceae bacterium]
MTASNSNILELTENYLTTFFQERIGGEYVFHDIHHTLNVVESAMEIGLGCNLDERELELLQLAAWFHDSGYDQGAENHEERSCHYAVAFLSKQGVKEQDLDLITRCIMATKLPFKPKDLLEEIICDADLSHLGKKVYWDRCGRLRQELLLTRSRLMSEAEWVEFELNFMNNHRYFTAVAEELYNERKLKHIKQLRKQQLRLNPKEVESVDDLARKDKKKKKNKNGPVSILKERELELNQFSLGRGVETMYRTTYRTHINLSQMADNKANIMLSINAIVISIAVPQLLPKFDNHPNLILPTIMLLASCVVAIVLATLATRPKITEGKITHEDIEARRANLLFFGNFYEMKLEDFQWGMMEMIKDKDFLYSSMTKDIYYLGVVLAKKYRYLSHCYAVFMYGMIITVIAFALSMLL